MFKKDNILDDFQFRNQKNISDQLLIEITQCKSYPKIFVETAQIELSKRTVKYSNNVITRSEKQDKISLFKWMGINPILSVLALLTGMFSGFIGFGIVMVSFYQAPVLDFRSREKIWKSTGKLLVLLITFTIIIAALLQVSRR